MNTFIRGDRVQSKVTAHYGTVDKAMNGTLMVRWDHRPREQQSCFVESVVKLYSPRMPKAAPEKINVGDRVRTRTLGTVKGVYTDYFRIQWDDGCLEYVGSERVERVERSDPAKSGTPTGWQPDGDWLTANDLDT